LPNAGTGGLLNRAESEGTGWMFAGLALAALLSLAATRAQRRTVHRLPLH
jgi:MYXO-CTERM domain-containing protein